MHDIRHKHGRKTVKYARIQKERKHTIETQHTNASSTSTFPWCTAAALYCIYVTRMNFETQRSLHGEDKLCFLTFGALGNSTCTCGSLESHVNHLLFTWLDDFLDGR